jgi:hypothetical protein
LRRFLLKGVDDPNFLGQPQRVDDAECITANRQRYLEYTQSPSRAWLRNIGFPAFSRDCQRRQEYGLSPLGKCLEIPLAPP